jgi:hypothetical protein
MNFSLTGLQSPSHVHLYDISYNASNHLSQANTSQPSTTDAPHTPSTRPFSAMPYQTTIIISVLFLPLPSQIQ